LIQDNTMVNWQILKYKYTSLIITFDYFVDSINNPSDYVSNVKNVKQLQLQKNDIKTFKTRRH